MFELEESYMRGGRTRFFLLFKYGWLLSSLGVITFFLIWQMNFGFLNSFVSDFLSSHPDWVVTIPMLTLWLSIFAFDLFLIGYIRGNLMFRHYKFMLDSHAFHLKKGLFMVKEITIPYHQINNVHIIRPYFYRLLGVSQVDIVTASDKGIRRNGNRKVKDCLIPIIDYKLARMLSKQLITYADRVKQGEEIDEDDYEYDYDIEDEDGFEEELDKNIRN